VDLLVSLQRAQSASQYAFNSNGPLDGKRIPWLGACLMYLNTLCAASKWGCLGLSMNWLSIWTAYARSGRVMVRYIRRPTNLRYWEGSSNNSPSPYVSVTFCSAGKREGLAPRKPVSSKISNAYFLWHKEIPCLDLATSIPRKYFNCPISFSLNWLDRKLLVLVMSSKLFPARITSSTYINKAVNIPWWFRMNKE